MAEQAPSVPVEPTPAQDMPSIMGSGAVVVPPEPAKKGPGLLWLAVVLGVAIIGGSAYFYYAGQQKPVENVSNTPPPLVNQANKPNEGFNTSKPTSTPTITTTPALSSSDSITDIEKDLSTTTIESGNSSEFTTDLQSL
ncbi:MAG: hypothetical protein Q8L37_01385 [Candidatus Gottesmanbacteria bacterium]|nr:hypothetical protein [Candidatus Gottesmanbacteria bacterium]